MNNLSGFKIFCELLRESVLISGIIALMCVGAVVYLAVRGMAVPDVLSNLTYAIVAFFFGGRVAKNQAMQQTGEVISDEIPD